MRIAYLARWDLSRENGVAKKIAAQVRAWLALGHQAKLFALTPRDEIWAGMREIPMEAHTSAGGVAAARGWARLLARVEQWMPDVGYLRFAAHYPPLEWFMRRTPVVLELNTIDLGEYPLYCSPPKLLYHRFTRNRLLGHALGMVSVTHEIAAAFTHFRRPMEVIANGIDLSHVPTLPASTNAEVRAVFLGSPSAVWHGVDKIAVLAERLPEWTFDVVGPEIAGRHPPNVVVHGVLGRTEYQRILSRADVALGSLALHRSRMDEACSLKLREYLAFGLPCVFGHRDPDLEGSRPFVLQLPNTPDNILAFTHQIRTFGEAWRGRRVQRSAIRLLDVSAKEERRMRFMSRLLSAPGMTA